MGKFYELDVLKDEYDKLVGWKDEFDELDECRARLISWMS